MKCVIIEINECRKCPFFADMIFNKFCEKVRSVDINYHRRPLSDVETIPSWCPLPDKCHKMKR